MPHRKSARLAGWQVRLLVWAGVLLWLSGVVWLGFHYFGRFEGEFGPEINPLEIWMLRLHGLVMIPAFIGLGSLTVTHIPLGWKDRAQRPAAIALLLIFGLLIISGYALYYTGSVEMRDYSSLIHWIIGLPAPLIFLWHYRRRYSAQGSRRGK